MNGPANSYRQKFVISGNEKNKLGIFRELGLFIQEASTAHSTKMGISINALNAAGLTWVLARQQTLALRLPMPNEEIEVETWPAALSGVQCRRDFTVRGNADETICSSITNWAVVNLQTRRAERIPEFIAAKYPAENYQVMPEAAIKPAPLSRSPSAKVFRACAGDIDINEHVTSTRYVDFMLGTVPDETKNACRPVFFDIIYRAEALEGDSIESRVVETSPALAAETSTELAALVNEHKCRAFWHNLLKMKKTVLFISRKGEKELVRGFSLWIEE